jgi:uncharacterized protein
MLMTTKPELGFTIDWLARCAAILMLAGACLGTSVRAQQAEPSKAAIALAHDVLVAKGATATFDPVVGGVIETVKNSLLPTNPSLSRELTEVAGQLHREYDSKRGEIIDQVATAYAAHFSEQELKDMLLFYKTPLGQKIAREEPAAIQEGFQRASDWSHAFADTVMNRVRSEMQKKGHSL